MCVGGLVMCLKSKFLWVDHSCVYISIISLLLYVLIYSDNYIFVMVFLVTAHSPEICQTLSAAFPLMSAVRRKAT